jgi:hypothetical protein
VKKLTISIALIVLLALGLAVSQEESPVPGNQEYEGFDVLDRNIRLTFELLDEDGSDNRSVTIVTALPEYKLVALSGRAQQDATFSVMGAAGPRNDGRILVFLEAEIASNDKGFKTEMQTECGVLLEPGEGQEVVRWQNKALVVHAEYAD